MRELDADDAAVVEGEWGRVWARGRKGMVLLSVAVDGLLGRETVRLGVRTEGVKGTPLRSSRDEPCEGREERTWGVGERVSEPR